MPKRIQRKRTKGWKMPPNTVYVGRPSKWGNPFTVAEYGERLALSNYRRRVLGILLINPQALDDLRDKNLACWCREGSPCHADILLELANKPRCRICFKPQQDNGLIAWCEEGHVFDIAKDDSRYSER